jgi:hypothetical protein
VNSSNIEMLDETMSRMFQANAIRAALPSSSDVCEEPCAETEVVGNRMSLVADALRLLGVLADDSGVH